MSSARPRRTMGFILTAPCHETVLGFCTAADHTEARKLGANLLGQFTDCECYSGENFMCARAYRCHTLDDQPDGWQVDVAHDEKKPAHTLLLDRKLARKLDGGGFGYSAKPGEWKALAFPVT